MAAFVAWLPSVQADLVHYDPLTDETEVVINRIPEGVEIDVPADSAITFQVFHGAGAAPDPALMSFAINGEPAFVLGVAEPGFGLTTEVIDGYTVAFTVVRALPFDSQELVGLDLDTGSQEVHWSFVVEDLTRPVLADVQPRDVYTLRALFSEAMDDTLALDPERYVLTRVSTFAVAAAPARVTKVSDQAFDLTFPIPLTFGAVYTLTASGDQRDLRDNPLAAAPNNQVTFAAFNPAMPPERRFQIWDWIPQKNKRDDKTRDLFRFISVLQEPTNLLLYEIDRLADVADPDLAPEDFVDAMLADLGNPFRIALTLEKKRRLLGVLVPLYQLRGTMPGIVAAAHELLGLTATVRASIVGGWVLGDDELGESTVLGAGESYQRFSFDVVVDRTLTPTERTDLIEIIQYMKRVGTHLIRVIEPGSPTENPVIDHLELGLSELGVNWQLH